MSGRVLVASLVTAVLAVPGVQPATPTDRPAVRPCPAPKISPPADRPPRPKPPAPDPDKPVLGGEGMDTAGLIVPPGTPAPPALTATSWLVADLDTGAVLGGCGPHEYATPASVQKLLLAATMLPKLDAKQTVKIVRSDLDIEPGSSAVGLLEGGRYRIETLWLGLMLNSGNDAANTLARLGGGAAGAKGGVAAMNAEARRLGAYETHAVTPSGLDGRGQFTSAYDLALIARVCFDRADFRRYVATERAQMPAQPPRDPRGFQIQNDNQLLLNYPGTIGGKTGFTNLARHSFVGAAERDGRRLVVTLLGAEARPLRSWQQAAALLDWGFALPADAAVGDLVTPEQIAQQERAQEQAASPPARAVPAPARVRDGGPLLPGWWHLVVAGLAVLLAATMVAAAVRSTRRRRGYRGNRRRATRSRA
ncbi:serine hydrolase [Solwaraspora sp. WMMD1047]|uniref:D-alanyl-D-alanine carboxypeptidase family protein n=1 Tax=Solwaraspora sp. WMMD1047 TaxID=3016102 RepID=UPI002416DEC8|nr:serine hydrolase [Solwaraspora sp. WMMD1047]MDG4832824.1 serine hydrolase [Solwaraspora sp. WMMD1047]